jgi:hypothetical protein
MWKNMIPSLMSLILKLRTNIPLIAKNITFLSVGSPSAFQISNKILTISFLATVFFLKLFS